MINPNDIPTPRVEEMQFHCEDDCGKLTMHCSADFARTLERETIQLARERDELLQANNKLEEEIAEKQEVFMGLLKQRDQLQKELSELKKTKPSELALMEARNQRDQLAKELSEARAEVERMREHSLRNVESDSAIASCACLTKSPEPKYHKPGCKYRLICERDQLSQQVGVLKGALTKVLDAQEELEKGLELDHPLSEVDEQFFTELEHQCILARAALSSNPQNDGVTTK